jgi:hypothetical protein
VHAHSFAKAIRTDMMFALSYYSGTGPLLFLLQRWFAWPQGAEQKIKLKTIERSRSHLASILRKGSGFFGVNVPPRDIGKGHPSATPVRPRSGRGNTSPNRWLPRSWTLVGWLTHVYRRRTGRSVVLRHPDAGGETSRWRRRIITRIRRT